MQLTVLIPALLLTSPALAQSGGEVPGDAEVLDALEHELILDPGVRSDAIDARCVDGVVELDGQVGNLLAKERATAIAETVRGVRSVVDLLEVRPDPDRTDAEILADVQSALLLDPATDSYEVSANIDQGVVRIAGTVDSWTERELCGTVVKGVTGVREVKNEIDVAAKGERPDDEIRAEVLRALRWDPLVDHALISVSVKDGAVDLGGIVGSAAEKTRATMESWVSGVRIVDAEDLEVARWARDDDLRQQKYVTRSDDAVRQAVADALIVDPRVLSFDIDVSVENGVATLRGTVDNLKSRRAAEQAAHHTVGVYQVRDHIKVRPEGNAPDAEIAGRVSAALTRDPFVERYDLEVRMSDGVAYLSGEVDSRFEKAQADDVVSRVPGVVDVVNLISVSTDTYGHDPYVDPWGVTDLDWYRVHPFAISLQSDAELRDRIEHEYVWSPYVDADQISIRVDAGTVTLEGTVDSWVEWAMAQSNAYEAGATQVRNRLAVGGSD